MISISLLYFADAASIPAKLPTEDEIEASQDVFCDQSGRRVVGVGPHFVVKYGWAVNLTEGENMLFVRQSSSIPVPCVYALFENVVNRKVYIIMERIVGERLDFEWSSLNEIQKHHIATKLRANFDEMRMFQSPSMYCSVGNRPLLDSVFWTGDTEVAIDGPFETEAELNDALIKKYLFNKLPSNKADFYQRALPSIFRNHLPVFTHGDFQRKNILLRKDASDKEDEYEIVIIDWEFAGWYPSYWEYSRALFACGRWDDDWNRWVDRILDPFRNEWAWMDMLLKELWS